jgi:hypothetical protein
MLTLRTLASAAAALALGLAAFPASAAYVYTPGAAFETQEGASNGGLFTMSDQRLQWVFSASIFGDDPMSVKGVSFRFDSLVTNQSLNAGTFVLDNDFKVQMATLSGTPGATQDNNLAGGATVMSGARNLPFLVGGPAGETKPFGVHLVFETAYLYDPGQGDLVLDIFFPGQGKFGTMDYIRTGTLMSTVAGGRVSAGGPVARFDVEAAPPTLVPEPAAWALMIVGFAGVGGVMRVRRSQPTAW